MTRYRSITMASHAWLEGLLQPGDRVLDATAGNGGDTLWLAQQVGASGHVWAFDRQAVALENTQHSLAAAGLLSRVTLVEGNHAQLEHDLPRDAQANLAAIVFNLGYLPGADRGLTTEAASTLHALSVSWEWLRPGGALLVCSTIHRNKTDIGINRSRPDPPPGTLSPHTAAKRMNVRVAHFSGATVSVAVRSARALGIS